MTYEQAQSFAVTSARINPQIRYATCWVVNGRLPGRPYAEKNIRPRKNGRNEQYPCLPLSTVPVTAGLNREPAFFIRDITMHSLEQFVQAAQGQCASPEKYLAF